MLINLKVLETDLKKEILMSSINSDLLLGRFDSAVIYNGELVLEDKLLYIAYGDEIPWHIDMSNQPSFLCIGLPDKRLLKGGCDMLILHKDIDFKSIVSQVNLLFRQYQQWDLTLITEIANGTTLKEIGKLSYPILHNPINFLDENLHLLTTVLDNEQFPVSEEYYQQWLDFQGRSDENVLELVNRARDEKTFIQIINATKPTIIEFSLFPCLTLFQNIYYQNEQHASYCICLEEAHEVLTERHQYLVNHLSKRMQTWIGIQKLTVLGTQQRFEKMLSSLLRHHYLPKEKIVEALNDRNWEEYQQYICLLISPNDTDYIGQSVNLLATSLSRLIPENCVFLFKSKILIIVNISLAKTESEKIIEQTLPILHDSHLIVGISMEFSDFKDLYYHYQQCLIAIEFGSEVESGKTGFFFENYLLDYILEQIPKTIPKEKLYPESLKRLINYDKENETEYVKILKVYLECNMSPVITSKKLFMYKNTLLYRINRIKEILDVELKEPEIQLLFRILLCL